VRSLFLKIFLWFGLAMVLVNVASFITGVIAERRSQRPFPNPLTAAVGVYAQSAVDVFEKDGQPALSQYLERVEQASKVRAVLFTERGAEVSGRPQPPEANELFKKVSENNPFFFEVRRPLDQAARFLRSSQGNGYVLVAELPRPPFLPGPPRLGEPGSFLFGLRLLGQRLLPILLVGALLCYFLARHLSTPIVQLRQTTQQLAAGELQSRVDSSLLSRRDEIGYLGQDFNVMAERIQTLVEAQRRLLGDISHELRSPLARQNVAIGIARRQAGAELTGTLDRIAREAERLNEMIGQLLTLSRTEVGAASLNTNPIDLCELVQEIAENANFEARAKDRSVRLTTMEPCRPKGAPDLLSSAIENVVRNAVRYTAPQTEVEISVRCESSNGNRDSIVSVRDHGPGVSEADIQAIFRPFYRAEDARDRMTGGTGLGLSIADRAVRLHGGVITARNASDGGLIVEIRIPTNS
jgi:signal transduction histidine kinase